MQYEHRHCFHRYVFFRHNFGKSYLDRKVRQRDYDVLIVKILTNAEGCTVYIGNF